MSQSGFVVEKVKTILSLWTSLANHVRMRDRSVKVLQYGCQMLMGYYAGSLSDSSRDSLAKLRRASSSSRKAFWLLKSLNHVGSVVSMVESGVGTRWESELEDQLDFIEQLFLIFYYWYESQIYFARAGLFGLDEDVIDPWCNGTWLGGDLAFFFSCLLRSRKHKALLDEKVALLASLSSSCGNSGESSSSSSSSSGSSSISRYSSSSMGSGGGSAGGGDVVSKINEEEALALTEEIEQLHSKTFDMQLSLAIAVLELGVSLHYCYVYKWFLKEDISEGHVGLMGVCSSTLILYEGLLKFRRELSR